MQNLNKIRESHLNDLRNYLTFITWENDMDWNIPILKLLFDTGDMKGMPSEDDGHCVYFRDALGYIINDGFDANLWKFMEWLNENTIKYKLVKTERKILVQGIDRQELSLDEDIDNQSEPTNFEILQIVKEHDWGVIDTTSTKRIKLVSNDELTDFPNMELNKKLQKSLPPEFEIENNNTPK